MFPEIAYLDWIVGRPERADHDLGSSDLARAESTAGGGDLDPDGVVPLALADRPTPDATAAELLAELYCVSPENVLVTAGASHANFLAMAASLPDRTQSSENVGSTSGNADESSNHRVLVEKPGYEPLLDTPRGLGATVDRFRRPAEDGYPLDPDRVAGAVVEDTALVVTTNRHNPSGRRVDRDGFGDVATAVGDASRISTGEDEAGARLLVDEVYAPFGDEPVEGPFGGPTAAGLDGVVVTSSLTKLFGLGDVRLGWLVADAEFVARARSVAYHVPAVSAVSERLARRALADADRLAEISRERVQANHDALSSFVAGRDDLSGTVEPGCPYAFLEHESADGTAVAEAAWDDGVLVVPGRFFDDSDRFRLAACRDPETVRASLDRLGGVLDDLPE